MGTSFKVGQFVRWTAEDFPGYTGTITCIDGDCVTICWLTVGPTSHIEAPLSAVYDKNYHKYIGSAYNPDNDYADYYAAVTETEL